MAVNERSETITVCLFFLALIWVFSFHSSLLQSVSGNASAPIKNIIALFMMALKKKALEWINDTEGEDLQPQDCQYIITLPAIWSERSKQLMTEGKCLFFPLFRPFLMCPSCPNRKAAQAAGLTNAQICLESEAAALDCIQLVENRITTGGSVCLSFLVVTHVFLKAIPSECWWLTLVVALLV
jgi:hypothetical protein